MGISQERLDLLRRLSEASGISGYEDAVRQVVRDEVRGLAEVSTDRLGSVICKKRGSSDEPRIMLAGHMDEIGFVVTSVSKEGFVRFLPVGGWWDQVMLAQRVILKTKKGDVPGVVGSKPPHVLSDEERNKVVKKKDMFIDIGVSSDEEAAELGVVPGVPVVPDSWFTLSANGKMAMGKAWDDRLGVAMFIDVMRALKDESHPNTVYGVATVQEEIGLRGAETSADVVNPHVGFALEVDIPGDTPGISESEAISKLGKGPSLIVLDYSMIPSRRLFELAVETAKAEGIPHQFSAMPGGGTDAGRIHIHSVGVPSLVICVPTRYIHSHTSMFNLDDYDAAVRLVTALVRRLDTRTVASLSDF
ncbi:MAG: M42 family metallopeptidase [Firmicutes bacterium]|nr:M42 family metallopeptidase [Bacillota bacterium]